jgi:hypothetical protein
MVIEYESDSILNMDCSASEYNITPSHNCACVNQIHSVNMIYARAVDCICCIVIINKPGSIFIHLQTFFI